MISPEKRFSKNLDLWARVNPKIAVLLPYFDSSEIESTTNQNGQSNLKLSNNNDPSFYFHSMIDIENEAQEWFSTLELKNVKVIYVYGLGLGYFYEAAKKWLTKSKEHLIVFLEDELAVIWHFFCTELATKILKDHKVKILFFKDLQDEEGVLEVLSWDCLGLPFTITALPMYSKQKSKQFSELHHKLQYDAAIKNALVDEYLRLGAPFFRNFYFNMLYLDQSYTGNAFFGKFPQVPAIICGAGPSFAKNIKLLGSLVDRALIFAGGSSLNALNSAGITPHFGAGIDPNAAQLERYKTNQAFELPFFYRNRLYHPAFLQIHGPKLYIAGSGGYDVSDYYEEKFNLKTEFLDEGHNVVNFCVEVAHAMGCNPIIFVGMDLAFTDMQAYVSGVIDDATVSKQELFDTEDFDEIPLVRKDIFNNPVYTLWKWVAESNWIGEYAKKHPELVMVNATEGGIGFPEIEDCTLKEASERLLPQQYDLRNRVHGEIQNSLIPHVSYPELLQMTYDLRDSLSRCIELFSTLTKESQIIKATILSAKKIPQSLQSGLAALTEIDLLEECAFINILEIFNIVYDRFLNRKIHLLNSKQKKTDYKTIIKKIDLTIEKFHFLSEVAKANVEIINYTIEQVTKNRASTSAEVINE